MFLNQNGSTLFRHRGQVFVAAVQFPSKSSRIGAGFAVWQLRPRANAPPHDKSDEEVADWVEVARTPPHLSKQFDAALESPHANYKPKIIFSGGLICLTACLYGSHAWPKHMLPLVYDLDQKAWSCIPPYKGHCDLTAVFGVSPSLPAAVA
ncbi:hypothetical protein L7F22_033861 [Adiantum nelumboides]|nr:hypothetical protein [Adiantum nelumboides]MCO5579995.1 hypothetical protein [Adiantum nelumboides]